ncbi:PCMD domain-containing protein [Dysgonomonas sp. 216]|uniref:PCMD domain-containing protein n=1 Tax=Dysgonomonas sp. 216 TaxID=2302934 RepID=UPI0013D50E44|nr:PCMD domain-containing protein [Dysgonomonas sp. 216]
MKNKLVFTYLLISSLLFASCIKDEPLYSEVDIDHFLLDNDIQVDFLPARNNIVTIVVSDTTGTSHKKFAPKIQVSPGATITPTSGDTVEFIDYKAEYIVESEDKLYKQVYIVNIVQIVPLETGFEAWTTAGGGMLIHPALDDQLWSSANQGIALATMGRIGEYPTRVTDDSYSGYSAALLETKKGGKYWGQNIPIFSGSLYRGKFAINLSNFVKSALFGQLHPYYMGRPSLFTGYYKYEPGKTFIDENAKEVPGRIDECSIHAVLYRIEKGDTSNGSYLNGENILTSERIVAKAVLPDGSAKAEYTKFEIPFIYTSEPDYSEYDYRLAVVFASSKEGDFYRGAIGSKLIVDDVEIICENNK